MTPSQFEKFKQLYKEINRAIYEESGEKVLENEKPSWIDHFFMRGRIEDAEKRSEKTRVSDYIYMLSQYENYNDIPPYYIEHSDVFSDQIDTILSDMEAVRDHVDDFQIAKDEDLRSEEEIEIGADENAAKEEAVVDVDGNFCKRTLAKMKASESWFWDSGQYKKMRDGLKAVDDYLNNCKTKAETFDSKKYMEMLDALEDSADEYLSHKVLDGVKENASGKVNAASDLKAYINERRAEYYRAQMRTDAEKYNVSDARAKELKEQLGAKNPVAKAADQLSYISEDYRNKGAEIQNSQDIIEKMKDETDFGHGISEILGSAKMYLSECDTDDLDKREVANLMLADLVRNELAVSGGKETPLLQVIDAVPEKVIDKIMTTEACDKLCNADAFEDFVQNGYQKNVAEMYREKLLLEIGDIADFSFSNKKSMISKETEICKQQRDAAGNDALNDAVIINDGKEDELPQQSKDANIDKNGFAKANANLAKFVKGVMNRVIVSKSKLTTEEREAGITADEKYEKYNELAKKSGENEYGKKKIAEYNKLANANLVNQKPVSRVANAEQQAEQQVKKLKDAPLYNELVSALDEAAKNKEKSIKEYPKFKVAAANDLAGYFARRLVLEDVAKVAEYEYSDKRMETVKNNATSIWIRNYYNGINDNPHFKRMVTDISKNPDMKPSDINAAELYEEFKEKVLGAPRRQQGGKHAEVKQKEGNQIDKSQDGRVIEMQANNGLQP